MGERALRAAVGAASACSIPFLFDFSSVIYYCLSVDCESLFCSGIVLNPGIWAVIPDVTEAR